MIKIPIVHTKSHRFKLRLFLRESLNSLRVIKEDYYEKQKEPKVATSLGLFSTIPFYNIKKFIKRAKKVQI